MATIQLDISAKDLQLLGEERIRELIHREVKHQRFRRSAEAVRGLLDSRPDVDWEGEFEQARREAFDEYERSRANRHAV